MRLIGFFLVFFLITTFCFAETVEVSSVITIEARAPNFWQEADITFWQTFPFATLWVYFVERQFSSLMFPGEPAHWKAILPFAVIVSAGNALIHARKVTGHERKRHRN